MKKIISKYYFIVVVMLIIADQFFIRLLLHSDLAAGLSDFTYYLSDMMLNFLVVLFALIVMIWSGKWQKINNRKFKRSYLFYSFLALLAFVSWNFVTFFLFPPTRNEISYQHAAPTFTGATAFLMYFLYPVIAGPIFEDMIYRGLVMTALEKGKKWGLDVLGSATLFGILHISNHGWVLTDFFVYMGGGLIFAVLFRMTKSIYWPIGLHIVYNGIGQILPLL
ncbi:TPA: CPBP family intramembrane metalloprotease [Streptococcus pneumoniae]|uniref:CPBP family intramembrane glutamic endopeptidase n=1 Tax=Streptococcus pneumoniae TaxID=1313 RepID=UPI000768E1EC|nr:CPBP family intramembrane glutamic endopeptidase [Streptococcus pneumoniae]VKH45819.1 metal-dependent CAAX amino terminal membrane protease family protein [Streptococcus pneumoniae]VMX74182.1 metal-dependent CAAX amino terminal membrane protease family protein [Streptococcus pneumoniae]VRU40038.1 metal-dependent CAAX amino terminal membrane protease family protein [Streptococcus pneumoniae]VTZ37174.1 metal-dependent CAAX amino terminal membrane protease family protein [Streptococcus pneumoni